MNLRSPFWGFKVDKVGDDFAAEKISKMSDQDTQRKMARRCWGQPRLYVTITISLADFMFMKRGQWIAGIVVS